MPLSSAAAAANCKGRPITHVETPAAVVDLVSLDANIAAAVSLVEAASSQHGKRVRIRPHVKAHKCANIALRQLELSHGLSVGVCCQKVSEAEAMVAAGISDVLLSNEVVSPEKIDRLVALATSPQCARITLIVDDEGNARDISRAAVRAGAHVGVLVEVDVGQHRCGVATAAEAVHLAQAVSSLPGVHFAGIQAYHGASQHLRTLAERQAVVDSVAMMAAAVRDAIIAAGLLCAVVTGGGSGTFDLDAATGIFTEVQPGSYALMDADYARNLNEEGEGMWVSGPFQPALFLLTGVMSARKPLPGTHQGWVVVDSGLKAQSTESGVPLVYATVEEFAANTGTLDFDRGRFDSSVGHLVAASVSDEHTTLVPTGGAVADDGTALPPRGTKILLIPSHCDPFVNHYDFILAVRRGLGEASVVEEVWHLPARGPGL